MHKYKPRIEISENLLKKYRPENYENLDLELQRVIDKDICLDIEKSLTYSGHKLQDRTTFAGMNISIENKKGSYREGVDADGHKWRTYMNFAYGYIRGTEGTDGDHVDCYLGPDKNAENVFVIHQNDPITHKYDEDKCMLGFSTADEAKKAYMKQYDRPGFFGSMDSMTIEEFKTYVFSRTNKGKRIHKSFEFIISGITENNKQQKIKQAAKVMDAYLHDQNFIIKHIPEDDSKKLNNITLKINDFNSLTIQKAVRKMSFSLDEPIGVTCGEAFIYKSQEDLTELLTKDITSKTKQVYQFMIDYFDLPEMRIVQKSKLRYKGQILYNPETGEAISKAEWRKFVKALKEFVKNLYDGTGEKIVIDSQLLGRILQKMSKTHSFDKIKKIKLENIEKPHRKFDWISNTAKEMTDVLGNELPRYRQARIQAAIDSAAQRVTKVTDTMRNDMQQIIIDGVKDRKSKSKISQELFDKCVGLNRDFQRIADTEIQNNTTAAYINEEVYNTKDGEKVYFKRFEVIDGNTCKYCQEIKDTIALFSDIPLESENIKDEFAEIAIWEGKKDGVPFGTFHPWCRGSWYRYYPGN